MTDTLVADRRLDTHWHTLSLTSPDNQPQYLQTLLKNQDDLQQQHILHGLLRRGLQQIDCAHSQHDDHLDLIYLIYNHAQSFGFDIRHALQYDTLQVEHLETITDAKHRSDKRKAEVARDRGRYLATITAVDGWQAFPDGLYERMPGRDILQELSYIAPRCSRGRFAEFKRAKHLLTKATLIEINQQLDEERGERRPTRGQGNKRKMDEQDDGRTPAHRDGSHSLATPPLTLDTTSSKRPRFTHTSAALTPTTPSQSPTIRHPAFPFPELEAADHDISESDPDAGSLSALTQSRSPSPGPENDPHYPVNAAFFSYLSTGSLSPVLEALFAHRLRLLHSHAGRAEATTSAAKGEGEGKGNGVHDETPTRAEAGAESGVGEGETGARGQEPVQSRTAKKERKATNWTPEQERMAVLCEFQRVLLPLVGAGEGKARV